MAPLRLNKIHWKQNPTQFICKNFVICIEQVLINWQLWKSHHDIINQIITVETYYLFSLFSNGPLSYRALNIDNIMSSLSHDYTTRLVQGSRNVRYLDGVKHTLMLVYHCHKPVFTPKMAIFRREGMREGGLPLPLAFHYLIFMILRACDLNLVMISLLASKCQDFKLRGL